MSLHGLIRPAHVEQSQAWRQLELDKWKLESTLRYTPIRQLDMVTFIGECEAWTVRRDKLLKEERT